MEKTNFASHIAQLKRIVWGQNLMRMMLCSACLFLGGYAIMTAIGLFGIELPDYRIVYGGLLGGAVVGAVLYVFVTRRPFINVLIDVDTRLHLQDRISTAYEYERRGKPSELRDLLIADASDWLGAFSPRQLFPFTWSRLHLMILLLMALNLALFWIGQFRPIPEQPTPAMSPEMSKRLTSILEKHLGKPASETTKPQQNTAQQQLYRQLEETRKKLEERNLTQKELMASLQKNLQELQGQRERLTQELGANLQTIDNLAQIPMRDLPRARRLSPSEMQKFKRMLDEMMGGELPEDVQQNLDELNQTGDAEAMLEQMMQELEANTEENPQNSASAQEDKNQDGDEASGQSGESSESQPPEQDQSESKSGENQSGEDEGQSDQQRMGLSRSGGSPLEEGEQDMSLSSEPGRQPGDGTKGPVQPIERAAGAIEQEQTAPARRPEYNVHIRSLTRIGEATVPTADVTRSYQQEVESVLHKEDIPLNYREFIKNYFIGIGLQEETATPPNQTE